MAVVTFPRPRRRGAAPRKRPTSAAVAPPTPFGGTPRVSPEPDPAFDRALAEVYALVGPGLLALVKDRMRLNAGPLTLTPLEQKLRRLTGLDPAFIRTLEARIDDYLRTFEGGAGTPGSRLHP